MSGSLALFRLRFFNRGRHTPDGFIDGVTGTKYDRRKLLMSH